MFFADQLPTPGLPELPAVWNALIILISGIVTTVLVERRGRRAEKKDEAVKEMAPTMAQRFEDALFDSGQEQLESLRADLRRLVEDRQRVIDERDRLIEVISDLRVRLTELEDLLRICQVENETLQERLDKLN